MEKETKRYMFIGQFDSTLLGVFSQRGDVIWVSSMDEALNQTGNFDLILLDRTTFKERYSEQLSVHYPNTPIIVDTEDEGKEPPSGVRFVNFPTRLSHEIAIQEKLAHTKLKVERLRAIHKDAKRVLILLHDNPDPDSIASALALRTLLKRNRQTASIGHMGVKVSRPENLAMIELMEIDLVNLKPKDLRRYDSIALVDVQPPYFNSMLTQVDSVIDHHPHAGHFEARYQDVNVQEGATSTILTEYLRAAQMEISEKLATALLYGIKTDTVTLNREANPDDIEAFTFLYPLANLAMLRRIERAEMPSDDIKSFGKALAQHWVENGIFFCNLGKVDKEYLIPKMADFGIQAKGVEWSVAFGIVAGKLLVISVRNVGYVKSAGRMVKGLFGEFGSAGGHRSAAKAVIALDELKKSTRASVTEKWIARWVAERFITSIAGEKQAEAQR